jgi:hypothetical protein
MREQATPVLGVNPGHALAIYTERVEMGWAIVNAGIDWLDWPDWPAGSSADGWRA